MTTRQQGSNTSAVGPLPATVAACRHDQRGPS